jgi:DNA modification methylase
MSIAVDVQMWPISRPIPYARNARVCPEEAISKVAGSIHEFGFKNPILVDGDGTIIAGHTRLLSAQRLELSEVPVIVCADLSPAKVKALRLADNRTAQETSWDDELLAIELEELLGLDVDLDLTGFDPEEIAAHLADPTEGLTGEDEPGPVPEIPATQAGDLWLLGKHRLLCGDSTSEDDVKRLMDGRLAVLMATDPPYLVDYTGGNHPQTWANGGKAPGAPHDAGTKHWDAYSDHESSVAFYRDFLTTAIADALASHPFVYQWFGMMKVDIVMESWRAAGLLPHQVLIWKKSRHVLTRCDFMWDYEPFMYGWVQGDRPESDVRPPANACAVWEVESRIEDDPGSIHPTMKPVELIRRPILYHTKPGGLIYEPFSGSGTAIIAAENTGRACCAMEQSPAFVDAAVARWEAYTGEEATLEGDGHTFSEVAQERLS